MKALLQGMTLYEQGLLGLVFVYCLVMCAHFENAIARQDTAMRGVIFAVIVFCVGAYEAETLWTFIGRVAIAVVCCLIVREQHKKLKQMKLEAKEADSQE